MAQSTAGIKLWYGESADGTTIPSSWTEIPDIASTPALGAAPAKLDATNLGHTTMKVYINGLQDLGGAFEFSAQMTPALIAAVDTAAVAPASPAKRAFSITFPLPIGERYWWIGECEPVAPGEASVDAVAMTTLFISQETELASVAFS